MSYGQIAIYCQSLHPNATGMSSRSIRRYCNKRNTKRITDEALQDLVRNMITLYDAGKHQILGHSHLVSQRRISRVLRAVAPVEHEARAHDLLVRTNPFRILHPFLGLKRIWIKMKILAKTMAARML